MTPAELYLRLQRYINRPLTLAETNLVSKLCDQAGALSIDWAMHTRGPQLRGVIFPVTQGGYRSVGWRSDWER